MAKRYATDIALKVAIEAVQILDGYGYMEDYRVARIMREAKINQIVEGTNELQRITIAKQLLKN